MSPAERFALWLKGFLACSGYHPDGMPRSLNPEQVSLIHRELAFATGDVVQANALNHRAEVAGFYEQKEKERIRNEQTQGQSAREMMDRMQLEANKQHQVFTAGMYATPRQRNADCPAHDTRCTKEECVYLGGGFSMPKGIGE